MHTDLLLCCRRGCTIVELPLACHLHHHRKVVVHQHQQAARWGKLVKAQLRVQSSSTGTGRVLFSRMSSAHPVMLTILFSSLSRLCMIDLVFAQAIEGLSG